MIPICPWTAQMLYIFNINSEGASTFNLVAVAFQKNPNSSFKTLIDLTSQLDVKVCFIKLL